MSDLQKAAEALLKALEEDEPLRYATRWDGFLGEKIQALRQALDKPENEELLKQGWRQCAVGQRTTQYCGMAEQARLEEREACANVCQKMEWPHGYECAAAIRARSEK